MFLASYGTFLSDMTLYQISNMVKGFALALGVAIAIVLAVQWWRRSQQAARAARQADAQRLFAACLLESARQPAFGAGHADELAKAPGRAGYPAFVGYVVGTAETILLLDEPTAWAERLTQALAPHRDYLASAAFRETGYRSLSGPLRAIVDALVADASSVAARGANIRPMRPGS